jgi:hypothetical protein
VEGSTIKRMEFEAQDISEKQDSRRKQRGLKERMRANEGADAEVKRLQRMQTTLTLLHQAYAAI